MYPTKVPVLLLYGPGALQGTALESLNTLGRPTQLALALLGPNSHNIVGYLY